jgi:RNA polymerase sigma-70 factor (ECF subfamily)
MAEEQMASLVMSEASDAPLSRVVQEIFKNHAQLVYRTAYGVTGSHEDAEDVLQATFVRLLQGELTPGLQNNPKAYLYRTAVNRSLDIIRSRRRQVSYEDAGCHETPSVANDSPDDALHRELYEAIAKLKPENAEIVILRYVHEKSDVEIARILGVSRGTVALRLFRSRARLKRLLRARLGDLR